AGQRVLVHGATGGVGHLGIQLAKAAGARVFATASSPEKLEIAMALGADVGINYREQSVDDYVARHTAGKGFDVVFDTVGGENLPGCFAAAAPNGTVASISTRCTCDLTPLHQKGLSLHVTFMLLPMLTREGRARHGEILRDLAVMVDAGKVRPLIHAQRFSFADVGKAHALVREGAAVGKVVLEW
ncbi:MAG TPA: zinc-binding dehydrogenase, partial [Methylomirabilota bacterium]|nr:zinc-binding dehydrogenase [Methylomirabilota bacterium]